MKIAERTAAWRRECRVLLRVSRAAWWLEQAEREPSWALASARAEGVSIRALAAAVRLSSSRVHQIVAAAGLDELDTQLGELRAAGWPAPEDPGQDRPSSWAYPCQGRRLGARFLLTLPGCASDHLADVCHRHRLPRFAHREHAVNYAPGPSALSHT
jgi:hypothetical protein